MPQAPIPNSYRDGRPTSDGEGTLIAEGSGGEFIDGRPTVAATGMDVHDDDLLMSQVKGGSVDAFAALYDRYSARAYRVARSICHDQGHAEDALQEAFLSIWRSRAAYQPQRGTVAAWLLTTVRYRAIDVARRDQKHASRRAAEHTLAMHPTPGALADQVANRDAADGLRALLSSLPDAQCEVITLAFYGELTHTEIATALDLPPGTVKGRMRLGLQKLRTNIEKDAA
jgi:RNA polymerase sigma-70 factor, ECF subfamily